MNAACIGEPVSWLRLERHALAPDPAIAQHLDACEACRACMHEITADVVALPPLRVPVTAPPKRKWWVIPSFAFAAAAAAAILLVILRPAKRPDNVVAWKGGELVLGLVRERAGAITDDPTTFRAGDRFKVVITCPPGEMAEVTVEVFEIGGYSAAPDRPLAPAQLACGNRIALPGAFSLTGTNPNRICVRVGSDDRSDGQTACLQVSAER